MNKQKENTAAIADKGHAKEIIKEETQMNSKF